MEITVELFGALRKEAGFSSRALSLPDGALVADAIAACGLADRVDLWAMQNGEKVSRDARLVPGGRIVFFQPVGGG
jgi:molybdopterin converting factor small subunit